MDAWQRAIDFMRALDERCAEQVVPLRWGRALINRRLHLVYDANYVRIDRVDGATVSDLVELAEHAQSNLGLQHRRVNLDDRAAAIRMADGFVAHDYVAERFLIMVHRRSADRIPNTASVRDVSWEQVRRARRLERQPLAWATDALIDQLLTRDQILARQISTRYFGALDDGLVVSSCELRIGDGCAQIETVETLPAYRNRGLARAVVSAALEAARGNAFIFLVADRDDWPQQLYRKLGFDEVGVETRFLRRLDAGSIRRND